MKKGGIFKSFIILTILLALIIYMGYKPFLSYMKFLSLKEKLNQIAKFSKMQKSLEEVRASVIKELNDSGFYFSPQDVSVYYEKENIVIKAQLSDTFKWFGDNLIKPINYKVEVKRLPVIIE
ncbi:MAG: hypothetical protein ABDH37_07880 [Candidatus Hydrothermales bacterium]